MDKEGLEIIWVEAGEIDGQQKVRPKGIRNKGGYLLFFPKIDRYPEQEERYAREVEEQVKLAVFIQLALKRSV